MKNTRNILLVAIIAATLVMGTSVIPMQSYASEEHKENSDLKSSIKSGTDVDTKSASQHQDQDNFCYRGDDCQQSNEGQQITGKDNEASWFSDQSKNLQPTPSTTGAASGTGNGTTPTPTPTTGTLNVCKEVINNIPKLTIKPSDFTFTFISEGANPSEFPGSADCTEVTVPEGPYSFGETPIREFPFPLTITVSGDCTQVVPNGSTFHGSIKAAETQTCTVTNKID